MKKRLKSEQGSTILFVMIAILVISVYGISSLKSSSSELMIASNYRCYKQSLYRAEAAVLEMAQVLDQEEDPSVQLVPSSTEKNWLTDGTVDDEDREFVPETADWEDYGDHSQETSVFPDGESGYAAVFKGIAPGYSLNMNNTTHMWQYEVYGHSKLCRGNVGVVAGYRRRF